MAPEFSVERVKTCGLKWFISRSEQGIYTQIGSEYSELGWPSSLPLLASGFPAISPVPASAASHTSFPTISKIGVGGLRVEVGWPGPLCLMEDKKFETQP